MQIFGKPNEILMKLYEITSWSLAKKFELAGLHFINLGYAIDGVKFETFYSTILIEVIKWCKPYNKI